MGMPLRIALLTLFAPALALAGDVVDEGSGTKITHSEDWRRVPERQQGSRPIVLGNFVERGKYVQFTVDVGSADNFDPDSWIKGQKMSIGEQLTDMTELKIDKEERLGGLAATGFTTSGKLKDTPLRLRAYIVKHGPRVIVFKEISFNGAHEAIGEEALGKLWDGISFQEAVASVGGENPQKPGNPEPVEDKLGNVKLVLPPSWSQVHPTPADAKSYLRGVFDRRDDRGDRLVQAAIFRYEIPNPAMFKWSMAQVAEWVVKNDVFAPYYGEGSKPMLLRSLRVDESQGIDGVGDSCGFKISSRSMQEAAKQAINQLLGRQVYPIR